MSRISNNNSSSNNSNSQACSSRSPSAIAFDDDIDSGSEKCGFVCHVLMVLLAVLYTAWISSFYYYVDSKQQQQQQAPTWTIVFPTAVVCLFFAAPVLYGSLNAMTATVTHFDSLCTIQDKYSEATSASSLSNQSNGLFHQNTENGDIIPEICDLDVAAINDLVWAGAATLSTSKD